MGLILWYSKGFDCDHVHLSWQRVICGIWVGFIETIDIGTNVEIDAMSPRYNWDRFERRAEPSTNPVKPI